ncbi:MAG: ice-binding family protein, partial [Chloroflexota bacterium]
DFKGIILCQTLIAMNTGAALNGRALAQTAVTLDQNTIVIPLVIPLVIVSIQHPSQKGWPGTFGSKLPDG